MASRIAAGWQLRYETHGAPAKWIDLQRSLGIEQPGKGAVATTIIATANEVHVEWRLPNPAHGEYGLILKGKDHPVLYEKRSKRFLRLNADRTPENLGRWATSPTGRVRSHRLGNAEEFLIRLANGGPTLSAWIVHQPTLGRILERLWPLILPPLSAIELPLGLALGWRYVGPRYEEAELAATLVEYSRARFDMSKSGFDASFEEGFEAENERQPATALRLSTSQPRENEIPETSEVWQRSFALSISQAIRKSQAADKPQRL